MSLETLLTEYIFKLSVLRIVITDDVTCIFSREGQCRETNHWNVVKQCRNKTYLLQIPNI